MGGSCFPLHHSRRPLPPPNRRLPMFAKASLAAVAAASLLGSAAAAPLLATTLQLDKRDPVYSPDFNITYSSNHTEGLPRTLIMATGGTIAGASASATDSTNYRAGSIGVAALVEAVPQLLNVSNIDGMQVSNVGSGSITDEIVITMSKLANKALCSEDAPYDAVVVTHGTDTLEETAFTLDATLTCNKTLVVVGAMRPATAISADGPANLLEAVTTAVAPASHGRGVLITLNDRICQAMYCAKTHSNYLDTFKAYEQGFVGALLSTKPFFWYPPFFFFFFSFFLCSSCRPSARARGADARVDRSCSRWASRPTRSATRSRNLCAATSTRLRGPVAPLAFSSALRLLCTLRSPRCAPM